MAACNTLPGLKILLKGKKQIEQLRSIHVIQLARYFMHNNEIDTAKAKCSMTLSSGALLIPYNLNCSTSQRWKYSKKQKSESNQYDSDDDEDVNDYEDVDVQTIVNNNKNAKILNSSVSSMRIDAIVKAGMSMARNKAELVLYGGKLRVNGKTPLKKGQQIKIQDVIDLVHGPSPKNENFLLITRITILNVTIHEDTYKVKMLREKSLTIENYDDSWHSHGNES